MGMRTRVTIGMAAALLSVAPALAASQATTPPVRPPVTQTPPPTAPVVPSTPMAPHSGDQQLARAQKPSSEVQFLMDAGRDGRAEVALAELAQQKSTNPGVTGFAEQLMKDHTEANQQLTTLATAKNVSVPAANPEQESEKASLSKLSGAAFDRAYITAMVKGHTKAVDLFTKAAGSGDSDIKSFAQKTLPTLKNHLEMARKLQSSVGDASR